MLVLGSPTFRGYPSFGQKHAKTRCTPSKGRGGRLAPPRGRRAGSTRSRSSRAIIPTMDTATLVTVAVMGGFTLLLVLGIPLLYARLYVKVAQGQAIIVNKMPQVDVYFTGAMVLPVIHAHELIDVSVKTLELDRRGREGVHCKDDIRADIKLTFFVRINKTAEDIIRVAQSVGAARASDPATLAELFTAKFSDGVKAVAKRFDFEDLYRERAEFRDRIMAEIGEDLSGFVLDDVAIDYLEQTSLEALDPDNVLDAKGIEKITEITAAAKVRAAQLAQEEARTLARLEAETKDLLIELERRQADALAAFRTDTGRELTDEQLQERLEERLREMIEKQGAQT